MSRDSQLEEGALWRILKRCFRNKFWSKIDTARQSMMLIERDPDGSDNEYVRLRTPTVGCHNDAITVTSGNTTPRPRDV